MTPPRSSPPRIPTWVRVVLAAVIVAAAVWFLIIPQFADAEASLAAIEEISVPLVLAAFALQALSLMSYSALTGVVLGWRRLRYRTLLRIDLSDLAINHTVPGGGAVAGVARFRLFVSEGIPARSAIAAATVQISISNLALASVFLVGMVFTVAQVRAHPANYVLAVGVVVALLAAIVVAVWMLMARTTRVLGFARALGRRVPLLGEERATQFVKSLAGSLRLLGRDHRRMAWAWVFAAGNWLLDAASLWVMLAAFGEPIGVGPLLTVYGVGSILALLPLTPGGLGLVEGVMVPALIGFGVPQSAALLGVIGYRLFEYWLPIPVGGLAYLSLRVGRARRERRAQPEPPRQPGTGRTARDGHAH